MNDATRARLRAINRRFYVQRAEAFAASREHPWPGWGRVSAAFETARGSRDGILRVLDVGCGNGRFAAFLDATLDRDCTYVGIDASRPLLDAAERRLPPQDGAAYRFVERDVLEALERGEELVAERDGPFDAVTAFGVLHHVPGRDARAALVSAMGAALRAGGCLALTLWRFGEAERFARRTVAWAEYNAQAEEPIDPAQLEPGDHLLGFGDDEGAPRFCHAIDEEEWRAWIRPPLTLDATYLADGRSGDLNRYLLLRRGGAS